MNDSQKDDLLEELRKLRGEVRALRHLVFNGIILLVIITAAVASELRWFKESFIGTAIGAGFVWCVWLIYQLCRASRDSRKKTAPARVVITPTQPATRP